MTTPSEREEHDAFEAEVRRVAEAVWRLPPGDCQPEHYTGDPVIRELDGIVRLRDASHLIMATVSRRLEKARDDIKKLNAAEKIEKRNQRSVSKWFVTKYQLNAEHLKLARENQVHALTLDNFRSRFFNGRDYVAKRRAGAFGSARNLKDGSITIEEDEYVELPMVATDIEAFNPSRSEAAPYVIPLQDLVARLRDGRIVVLQGPFGAGKSLTSREVFLRLAADLLRGTSSATPVAVNLREHWGQPYGDEVLERHARSIGFTPKEDLVVAWRAGLAILLLDGFDELASQVVARPESHLFMREARLKASLALKDLVGKMPTGSGILVSGRDHYFDNITELRLALGLVGKSFTVVELGEFTEDSAQAYLRKKGLSLPLPDWLPRKPLILGYLAHKDLLEPILRIDASKGFGHAWDEFLTLICVREAEHERSVMEPETLRRLLERVASDVRSTSSGTGPIHSRDLAEAYRLETGQVPGEGVLMQLQRLPGLTQREQDPQARSFIDHDFLAALQGSAVARFVLENPIDHAGRSWLDSLSPKSVAMASHVLTKAGATVQTVMACAGRVVREYPEGAQLAGDCLMIGLELAGSAGSLAGQGVVLKNMNLGVIDIEDLKVTDLYLDTCILEEVILGPHSAESTVTLKNCLIKKLSGVASERAMPQSSFQGCTVDAFDDMSTNNAVIRSSQPPEIKALLTVLRKLFVQAGGGRLVSGLKRGLPQGPILNSIETVLRVLEAEGVVFTFDGIAHPVRRQAPRIHRILEQASLSTDPIVVKVREG